MIFLLNTIIPHGNFSGLSPAGQMISIFGGLLVVLMAYGINLTFGPGKKDLKDQIDEHSKMHELGIAHGHEGKRAIMTSVDKDFPKHKHD
tara:strand:+ start:287 stop:556 length:270 start_codon:yes stop_codon:yes gene_type:complete